jgi:hypothetical protein
MTPNIIHTMKQVVNASVLTTSTDSRMELGVAAEAGRVRAGVAMTKGFLRTWQFQRFPPGETSFRRGAAAPQTN